MLNTQEQLRYLRQTMLSEINIEGQNRLKAARVLIVGIGGLGCPATQYLCGAGVGTLGLADNDRVDLNNLHRQLLYTTSDVGQEKTHVAKKRLHEINPHTIINSHPEGLSDANAFEIIRQYDMVLDGTDNLETRYLINDTCLELSKTVIYGSVSQFDGQVSIFCHPQGPCYRCLFPQPPPTNLFDNCANAGVLGVLPGMIGLTQATETLKLILGIGQSLVGRLLCFNALTTQWRKYKIDKDPACSQCTQQKTEAISAQPPPHFAKEITSDILFNMLLNKDNICVIDLREIQEYTRGHIEGAHPIPLPDIHQIEQITKKKDSSLVVYCATGLHSPKAVYLLSSMGYRDVRHLVGGFKHWSMHYATQGGTED